MRILLKNANLIETDNLRIGQNDVLLENGLIKKIAKNINNKSAPKIIDIKNQYLSPGLIDGHIHIESSFLNPFEFSKIAIINGVTAVVADPHEIVNVAGEGGMRYMLSFNNLPIDIFYTLPSCVPATSFETSGAEFGVESIKKFIKEKRVLGLAEVMNYPAVINQEKETMEKIAVAKKAGKIVDGHCPGLTGADLKKYVSAGISSDHESVSVEEGREKLGAGLWLMIRDGTAAKNLNDLIGLINKKYQEKLMFVTDDKHVDEMMEDGYINGTLKKAVAKGINPLVAVKLATYNPAKYFHLADRGLIKEGYKADLTVFDNLKNFKVKTVIKNGQLVYHDGKLYFPFKKSSFHLGSSFNVKKFTLKSLKIKTDSHKKTLLCRVIKLIKNQIVTNEEFHNLPVGKKEIISLLKKDIIKIVVVERHKKTGNVGLGFIKGFTIKNGAIASSVSHDSHNIIAAGSSDKDIYLVVNKILKMKGGLAVVSSGKILAHLALPIGGLMSKQSYQEVAVRLKKTGNVLKKLGCRLPHPFITLSFMALPVIPKLKITDKGLFNVKSFSFVKINT